MWEKPRQIENKGKLPKPTTGSIILFKNSITPSIQNREYRVTMAEELRNLPIQGDYVTPPP